MRARVCAVDGCDRRAKGRGWCAHHYYLLWTKQGNTFDRSSYDPYNVHLMRMGIQTELTIPERLEIVAEWSERGLSAREIAERVGVDERTIYRDRQKLAAA